MPVFLRIVQSVPTARAIHNGLSPGPIAGCNSDFCNGIRGDVQSPALCPICSRVLKKPHKAKLLFGVSVCKKCRSRFAGRRQLGYVIDTVAWGLLVAVPGMMLTDAGVFSAAAAPHRPGVIWPPLSALLGLNTPVHFFFNWVLPLLFFCKDGFHGMSPGKWLAGVQVVDRITREPIGFLQSFKRNLVLMIPMAFLVIAHSMLKGKRIGDGWAGTEVIWRKYAHKSPFEPRGIICRGCGYNLTGNVSGRCPECFTPVTGQSAILP